ncbi:MAG: hypothetical protein II522_04270 [Clostridia bacterium]|nr:hypothetical protein [Clostridia bacterium]
MNERGKLQFKDNSDIENNEELRALREHWQSFADAEADEREKYLRELEIKFSMDSFVADEGTEAAKGRMASYVARKKAQLPSRKNKKN